MKRTQLIAAVVWLMIVPQTMFALPDGFFLPDSIREMTLRYRSLKDLVVLRVTINDTVDVNLILDTGCRNLVLFGKKFEELLRINEASNVQFSGLGSGKPVSGKISLDNKVAIDQVLGNRIAIVVVPSKNLFKNYRDVDGVIGFELFLKFEIELNAKEQTVKFRPANFSALPEGFTVVPLRVEDTVPVMYSTVLINNKAVNCDLMIDTGSNLALLMRSVKHETIPIQGREHLIGVGFNGSVNGFRSLADRVTLAGVHMRNVPTGIIVSDSHDHASIGMAVLKEYVVILNYLKLYAGFREA